MQVADLPDVGNKALHSGPLRFPIGILIAAPHSGAYHLAELADDFNLGRLSSFFGSSGNFQRLSFGGVVGRLAWVVVAAALAIAYAAAHTTPTGALIGILAILLVVLVMAGVVLYVVKTKPELSILDGGYVISYKQLTIGTKDFVPSGELPPVPDPGLPDSHDNGGEKGQP